MLGKDFCLCIENNKIIIKTLNASDFSLIQTDLLINLNVHVFSNHIWKYAYYGQVHEFMGLYKVKTERSICSLQTPKII